MKTETLAERARRVIQRDLTIKDSALAFNSPPEAVCCVCKYEDVAIIRSFIVQVKKQLVGDMAVGQPQVVKMLENLIKEIEESE